MNEKQVSLTPRAGAKPFAPVKKALKYSLLSEIEPELVSWLWYPYIPAGKLTILEGDPGQGKSWITCSLAADISAGRALPGQKTAMPPQKVLMLSAEDGLGDTVRPRIESLGGKLDNIYVSDDHFILDQIGLQELEDLMKTVAATFVVMDPIVAFLGGKMDMNKANETRAMMGPLGDMARRTGTSVVVVRHLRKGKGGKAIYSGIGSIDFTAAARSVLQVHENKGGGKFMTHAKHNLSAKGNALAYEFGDGKFQWGGQYDGDEDDDDLPTVSTKSLRVAQAEEFLFDALRDGPVAALDLSKQASDKGINQSVLARAKKGLARSEKTAQGWVWVLEGRDGIDAPARPSTPDQVQSAS